MTTSQLNENQLIPYTPTSLNGHKVLVLAPHPDDETLGCGGALLQHTRAGDAVKVLVMTNGACGDVSGQMAPQDYIAARQAEFVRACKCLGITAYELWDYEDRGLLQAPDAVERLRQVITDWAPAMVYAPSPLEYHPDHRAAAILLWESLQKGRHDFDVLFYEINQPLAPNTLVDITGVMPAKLEAARCYVTQLREQPYDEITQALNRFRSITLGPAVTYAEGFLRVAAQVLRQRGLFLPEFQKFQMVLTEAAPENTHSVGVDPEAETCDSRSWDPAADMLPAAACLVVAPDPLHLLERAAGTLALWRRNTTALAVVCELPNACQSGREAVYTALAGLNIHQVLVLPESDGFRRNGSQALVDALKRWQPEVIMAPTLTGNTPEARFGARLVELLADTGFAGWFYGYTNLHDGNTRVDVRSVQRLKTEVLSKLKSARDSAEIGRAHGSVAIDGATDGAAGASDSDSSLEYFQRYYLTSSETRLKGRDLLQIARDARPRDLMTLSDIYTRKTQQAHSYTQLKLENERLQTELSLITQTFSWRITRPLRVLKLFYRTRLAGATWRERIQLLGALRGSGSSANSSRPHAPATVQVATGAPLRSPAPAAPDLELGRHMSAAPDTAAQPLISIIMPVYNTPRAYLEACLNSVAAQTYSNWELCIADDASTRPEVRQVLEAFQAREPARTHITWRSTNGHICAASNTALQLAQGEFVALLDHDDLLTPDALQEVVAALQRHPRADMLYSDEDKVDDLGKTGGAFYKPDWSPEMFMGQMYTCHLAVFRRSAIQALGGFRLGCEGAQDYDLVLRLAEISTQIYHIPRVLYHWRMNADSTAASPGAKPYAFTAALKVVQESLERQGEGGFAEDVPDVPGCNLVRYPYTWNSPVSILILTRDQADILDRCLTSIYAHTPLPTYEIILVDNGSKQAATFEIFEKWQALLGDRLIIQRQDIPFNFSVLNNQAARVARGKLLLLLNNDVEVLTPGWLTEMAGYVQRPAIGAAGAMLLYPDFTIQHAGVVLGITGTPYQPGVAGHSHKHLAFGSTGYFNRLKIVSNYSAVTGACLMVRRQLYLEVGGLEENLTTAFGDVDFCLKLLEAGYRNVVLPHVCLLHHESKSRGYEDTPAKQKRFASEINFMLQKWPGHIAQDRYYNPNLTLWQENFAIKSKEELQA